MASVLHSLCMVYFFSVVFVLNISISEQQLQGALSEAGLEPSLTCWLSRSEMETNSCKCNHDNVVA